MPWDGPRNNIASTSWAAVTWTGQWVKQSRRVHKLERHDVSTAINQSTIVVHRIHNVQIQPDPDQDRIIRFWIQPNPDPDWIHRLYIQPDPWSSGFAVKFWFTYLVRLFSEKRKCATDKLEWALACVSVRLHTDQSLADLQSVSLDLISCLMTVVKRWRSTIFSCLVLLWKHVNKKNLGPALSKDLS